MTHRLACRIPRLVLFLLVFAGCRSMLVREVNKQFPPVATEDRQKEALARARTGLQALSRVDAYVGLSSDTLAKQLSAALPTIDPRVQKARVELGLQELVASIEFAGHFPEAKATLRGHAVVHAAIAIDAGNAVIHPSASRVELRSARLDKGIDIGAALPLINAALNTFLGNINGQIAAQRYPLDFNVVESFSPADVFAGASGFQNVRGAEIAVDIFLADAALLIDHDGVHVIAELLTGARDGTQAVAHCGNPPRDPAIGCDSDCPIWDVVCHARKIACETEKFRKQAEYQAALAAYNAQCGAVQAAADVTDIAATHAELKTEFQSRVRTHLELPDATWRRTAASVSRRFLAEAANASLGNALLCADYVGTPISVHVDHVIRTEPAPNLKCRENPRDCTPTRDCSATRDCSPVGDCNPNWACPDCEWYDVPCHARKAGCEADKQRYRTQCEIEKSARKADCERLKAMEKLACEAEKEAARLDCERLKAMEIAGCEINQAWLNQWGNYEVGAIVGDVSVSPVASFCIQGVTVDESFTTMTVRSRVSASTPVGASLTFTPYNLGNILCVGQWRGALTAAASIPEQQLNTSATINSEKKDDDLLLQLTTTPSTLAGTISPPPFAALIAQNPSFLVQCAPAVAGAKIVGMFDAKNDPFTKSDFEVKLPAVTLPLRIEPFRVTARGLDLQLEPSLRTKSLLFTLE